MGLISQEIPRNELESGDHIYSWRAWGLFLYSHHGIYVGDGKVVDFDGQLNSMVGIGSSSGHSSSVMGNSCDQCGDKKRVGGVKSSCLDCFLRGGKLYRYLYGVSQSDFRIKIRGMCTTAESDPAPDVIHRAEVLLQNNGFGEYNLRNRNCEDFSRYCKTGYIGCKSSQINAFSAFFKSEFSVRKYFKYRYENDIGVRTDDAEKISVEELVSRLHGPEKSTTPT